MNVGRHSNGGVPQLNANLRYWEYYGLQEKFDSLYQESKEGRTFNKLYELIISEKISCLHIERLKVIKVQKQQGLIFIPLMNSNK